MDDKSNRMQAPTKEIAQEEKEICEALAQSLICLDPATFQDIFSSHIEYIFDQMVMFPGVIALPQALLSSPQIVASVAGLLLRFLVERLTRLGEKDQNYATTILRLFKVLFVAVTQHPDKLEVVLRPHLGNIIMTSMKNSGKAVEPLNYFMLLRTLFRSIGGGRFELLYQEVLPFLQVLLESLNSLLAAAHEPRMRELFVELCLTVPVRLSVLLPYLSQLMKPLVYALQAGQELVSQGLRTLELCIDNLTQEFLEPIMAPVIKELMVGLWKHLKPSNGTVNGGVAKGGNNVIAMRILGKLGGRNRKFLNGPVEVGFDLNLEVGVEVGVTFQGGNERGAAWGTQWVGLDRVVEACAKILEGKEVDGAGAGGAGAFSKEQAFEFVKGCLALMLDLEDGGEGFEEAWREIVARCVKLTVEDKGKKEKKAVEEEAAGPVPMEGVEHVDGTQAPQQQQQQQQQQPAEGQVPATAPTQSAPQAAPSAQPAAPERSPFIEQPPVTREKKEAHDKALSRIMVAFFNTSAGGGAVGEQAWQILENLCRHIAILCINDTVEWKLNPVIPASPSHSTPGTTVHIMQSRVEGFLDAIVEVMCSEDLEKRQLAEKVILLVHSNCMEFLGNKEAQEGLPFLHALAARFTACCYQEVWFKKTGGVHGINLLAARLELAPKWMLQHELDFVKAILYVLKDSSADFVVNNMDEASSTLSFVLRGCNRSEGGDAAGAGVSAQAEEERTGKFNSLIALLISELNNPSAVVRETIRSALQLLADLRNKEVTEILTPVQERLLTGIFAKPLRALPFHVQIGNIDAITYCLSLRPPLLQFNDELMRLLHEALALADAEDQALVSKTSQYKNATSLIGLRTVCIRLLSAAMQCGEFSQARLANIRARIISVFFKSLYSKSGEIVEVANKGRFVAP